MLTRVEQQSSGPTGDSREGGAIGSKIDGSYVGTEPEMSRLERQPMLNNPPQIQDKEEGKGQ